ncbi:MAG TPA: hypothetical protein VJQ83_08345, partial [Tepidiformaceae bacterium]|nr:hypothetical protein [Tepidiformaceae bacterium]
VLFGLVFGAISPLRGLTLSERFAGPYFGRIIAIQTLFVALAHGLGPVIISWIGTDRAGYTLGFRLAAAALVASGVMTWWSMHRIRDGESVGLPRA